MVESRDWHAVNQVGSTGHGSSDAPTSDSLVNDIYLDEFSLSVI